MRSIGRRARSLSRGRGKSRSLSRGRKSPFRPSSQCSDDIDENVDKVDNVDNACKESDINNHLSFSFANVTVTLVNLSGLVCKQVASKIPFKNSSNDDDGVVISAVASFARNAFSSDSNIMTHVPSFPLLRLDNGQMRAQTARYKASWPGQDPHRKKHDVNHSSFSFSRILKQDQTGSFESEFVDINIGLFKGTELITLGCATIVIGDDSPNTRMKTNLIARSETPAKSDQATRRSRKSTTSIRTVGKKIKYATFRSDPTRRYSLTSNATLTVEICVSLSESTNEMPCQDNQQAEDPDVAMRNPLHSQSLPLTHIYPRPPNPYQNTFSITSSLTESTKSGYLVHGNTKVTAYSTSQESPSNVRDFSNFTSPNSQVASSKKNINSYSSAKCSLMGFFCCLPDAMGQDDNEIIIQDDFLMPMQSGSHSHLLQSTSQSQQQSTHRSEKRPQSTIDDEIYAPQSEDNYLFYTPQEINVEKNNQDTPTLTAETVQSIKRATQTLHHYADRFGMKPEELL